MLISISPFRFFDNFLMLFQSLTPLLFFTFFPITPQSPSQPLSQPLSHNHSPNHSPNHFPFTLQFYSNCSHFRVVSLLSNDYTFDLPSFLRSLLIFFKLILLLSLTHLAITHTLSIAHYFNSHTFISLLLSVFQS